MVEPITQPDTGPRGTDFNRNAKKRSKNYKSSSKKILDIQNRIRVIQIQPVSQKYSLINCPKCDAKVSSKTGRLEKHLLTVHAQKKEDQRISHAKKFLPISPGSLPPELYVCLVCGVKVKSLTKHANKTGHISPVTSSGMAGKSSKLASKKSLLHLLKCPFCRTQLPNKTQLESHIVGSHGKRALKKLGHQVRSLRPNTLPTNLQNSLSERATNLDGMYGWGGSFRDNGQFGSYPSYDAMDDDSFG